MSKLQAQVRELVALIDQDAGDDPRHAAQAVINDVPAHVLEYLAVEYLAAEVRAARRRRSLERERAAAEELVARLAATDDAELEQVTETVGYAAPGRDGIVPRKGTPEREEWETCTLAGRNWVRMEERAGERFVDNMKGMIDGFVENMKIEWTAELLATTFALPNGRVVTWGAATVREHELRQAMFEGNVRANAEGAARHAQAIKSIRGEEGANCLRDVVTVAA